MASVSVNLGLDGKVFRKNKIYNQVFENSQEVDSTDGFINLLSVSGTKGTATVPSIKAFCVYNEGDVSAEIQFKYQEWKNNSNVDDANSVDTGGGATVDRYATMILPSGDFFYLPHGRLIGYNADASAANATEISNTAPNSNMYVDSTADVDTATDGAIASGTTTTTLYLEDGHSKYFKVGDLIRLENEICEITAVGTGADLANSTCTIKRGLFGSTAATHADDVAIRLPFFNMTADFDKFSVSQTDKNGIFHAKNFFGYGRTGDAISDGIQAGSIAIKFYQSGYQEIGLSGITPNANSGLTVSTVYQFNITVDGGSAYALSFTTDTSNVNFGGKNGILNKIQDVLNTQYHTTASALNGKRISVGIVNGDIRWTFGERKSGSVIALTLGASGDDTTTELLAQAIGRFPAAAETAVATSLPEDTIFDNETYEEIPNKAQIMYDNSLGGLVSPFGSGTINYETGAINIQAYSDSEFQYVVTHSSGIGGRVSSTKANIIEEVFSRSTNEKMNSKILLEVRGK